MKDGELLQAYRNIGLEPEEITEYKKFEDNIIQVYHCTLSHVIRLLEEEQQGRLVELPCKVGADVFVSPNNGKSFHKARLYGKNNNGSHLVMVCDETLTEEEKHLVSSPIGQLFYDWFYKIYTKEEAEQALSK